MKLKGRKLSLHTMSLKVVSKLLLKSLCVKIKLDGEKKPGISFL